MKTEAYERVAVYLQVSLTSTPSINISTALEELGHFFSAF
jgi:hypothetical protein